MDEYLPFIVTGLVTGAVYALASMGLVLTYITSGVFNFAHGAVGMFATYIFYSLPVDLGWPTWLAIAVAVLGVAPLMGLVIDRVMLRWLKGASSAAYLVSSLGLLVGLQALAVALYGAETRQVAPIFSTSSYHLPGVNVGVDQTVVVAVAVAGGIALAYFLRRTYLGLQTRAVVGDPDLAQLVGTNSRRVTSLSWMLGCAFAALSGVLFAPFIQLDSLLLTLIVVQAFGAAIIGRLRSLPITNLGAYGVAVAAALATKFVATRPSLVGLPTAIPSIVLFVVLVLSPKGRFAEVTAEKHASRGESTGPRMRLPLRLIGALIVLAAALPPLLSGSQLFSATTTLIFVLIFSSLSLLVGLSRQLSLAHAVFAVFGATTASHLLNAGLPYLAAVLVAALLMVPLGALLAIPAIRLSGLFLALATFAFGVLAQNLLFSTKFAFGAAGVVQIARPSFLSGDTAFYYFALVVVVGGVLAVEAVRITRLGRVVRALGDSPTAIESLGINPTSSRVVVFCLAAFLSAVAGGLMGGLVQRITPSTFDFYQSLIWLTVLVTAGAMTLGGSLLAALLFIAVPTVLIGVVEWQAVFFGFGAILLAQMPNGLAGLISGLPRRLGGLLATPSGDGATSRLDGRRSAERYALAALRRAEARS